jgi:CheY-like chemotaxis protein
VQSRKRVLAVVDDLFFLVKIQDAAKRAGVDVEFVKTRDHALQQAATRPDLIVLDLNHLQAEPLNLIQELRRETGSCPRIMGFVSHVQADLRQQASQLGCDVVLPRSAFSANLPKLLLTYSNS